jgi:Tfp pilus assembly protein PilN
MIEINLLPKEYRKGSGGLSLSKAGKYVIIGVAGFICVLIALTFYQMHKLSQLEDNIEKAQRRATLLRDDIRMVDALMDVKTKITERMTTVEKLDRHRSAWVRILEDLGRNVPEFLWLAHFSEEDPVVAKTSKQTDQNKTDSTVTTPMIDRSVRPLEIEGYTFTLNALAAFMIKMMRSDYFDEVELVSAEEILFSEDGRPMRTTNRNQEGEKAYDFVLSCNVHYLTEEELRNIIAAANGSGETNTAETSHRQLN